jgi:hypothetical protein
MPSIGRFLSSLGGRSQYVKESSGFHLPLWMHLPVFKSFNFILCHYLYMVAMTLLGSVLIYPAGELHYVDAFFFAAGAATQSGLNTYVPLA